MGFVDKIKDLTGFGDIDYDEELEEMAEAENEEKALRKPSKKKIVSINSAESQNRIVVLKPKCFNNSTEVADELKQKTSGNY